VPGPESGAKVPRPRGSRPRHGRRGEIGLLAILTLAAVAAGPAPMRDGYRLAVPPWRFEFPRDHAAHPEFRTEWWYYTGHLEGGGRSFGYELTFFRVGLDRRREASRSAWAPHTLHFAHLALTDPDRGTFAFHEASGRPALGMAGAESERYHVWVGEWSARLLDDRRTHRLGARSPDLALGLDLAPLKPPVIHGQDGVSRKSAGIGYASHYYSLTRMATEGWVRTGRESLAVTGVSWMDHEFGSGVLATGQVGWDWFSVQLDDGRELMLCLLRLKDGGIEPMSSGTLVRADGTSRHLKREEFEIETLGRWTSRASGAVYPHGWRVRVPGDELDLRLQPTVAGQELIARDLGDVVYWEGSVRANGTRGGSPVAGTGYVELTGYAGAPPGTR
jgi:predicted secreted hydrolase